MRYVVYGAGAVGGTIGGLLCHRGHDVALVARGEHGRAIATTGLHLLTPESDITVSPPVAATPADLPVTTGDVVILAVKSQDTVAALDALRAVAGPDVPVVCAQNGVANEREALRRFARVYGMCVMLPGAHLEPGVVLAYGAPCPGLLDLGLAAGGTDDVAVAVAAALTSAGFDSRAVPDVMRWKYGKLLLNLSNVIEAACGELDDAGAEVWMRARAEAEECLRAAGIEWAGDDEDQERRGELMRMRPVQGERRGGGSTWQSLARATGSVETDYLNGEVVLLGRLHGVPTPVNEMLRQTGLAMAAERRPPGAVTAQELLDRLPS